MSMRVVAALQKALKSQFHPKMIQAIFLPFAAAIFLFAVLMIFAWHPASGWLASTFSQWGWVQWLQAHVGSSLSSWLGMLIAFTLLTALSGIVGLAAAAVLVTPMAIKLLSKTDYADLEKKGRHVNRTSIVNALKVGTIFIAGWLITLPLWLIPMMPMVLTVFWGAYAFSQMCKVDAVVEHASPAEREVLLHQHNKGFWMIGLVCGVLCLIPFMGFVMPVFSILACTHYGLSVLRSMRQQHNADSGRKIISRP